MIQLAQLFTRQECLSLLVLPLALSFAGCRKSETPAQATLLQVSLGPAPDTFDWQLSREALSGQINLNIMRGLFSMDGENGQVRPDLVANSNQSKEGLQWDLCLKKGIQWADGEALTSEHFVFAWRRLLDKSTGSPHSYRLSMIRNAMAFHRGELDFSEVGIRAISPLCLRVLLDKPSSLFIPTLAAPFMFPVRPDLIGHPSWPQHPSVSLGPYRWQNVQDRGYADLQANQRFQQGENRLPVRLHWIDSPETALRLYQQGRLDLIYRAHAKWTQSPQLKAHSIELPGSGIVLLGCNQRLPICREKSFRLALKAALGSHQLESLLPMGYRRIESLIRDIEPSPPSTAPMAKKDLVKPTVLMDKIWLASNNSEDAKLILTHLHHLIESQMGIQAQVQLTDPKTYFVGLTQDHHNHLLRVTWTPAVNDPLSYLMIFESKSEHNFIGLKDKKVDGLLKEILYQLDQGKRNALLNQLNQYLVTSESFVFPLLRQNHAFLLNKEKWHLSKKTFNHIQFSRIRPRAKKPSH